MSLERMFLTGGGFSRFSDPGIGSGDSGLEVQAELTGPPASCILIDR
ncbi:MAG: hypothetical protein HY287_13190 [Planctomycetes bacterium]|nr:hypothetical protein [Planctomycetota bacterium]MBI3835277.1 hypothetical protein [Planctomycetota bacterium]